MNRKHKRYNPSDQIDQDTNLINQQTKRQPMPVYWPAENVPYLPISYCQCFQILFAVLLISFITFMIIGFK